MRATGNPGSGKSALVAELSALDGTDSPRAVADSLLAASALPNDPSRASGLVSR